MTDEIYSYEGYGFRVWTSVVLSVVTGFLFFLLPLWNNFVDDAVVEDVNLGRSILFQAFCMENIRLASTMLLPRLWHKARGCYPSPRMIVSFNSQISSFFASCVILYHTLSLTLRWRNTPPFLLIEDTTEHIELSRWVGYKQREDGGGQTALYYEQLLTVSLQNILCFDFWHRATMEWTTWFCQIYFICDAVHMLMSWKYTKRKSMLLHHILFFVITSSGVRFCLKDSMNRTAVVYSPFVIFNLEESSTIFLNLRWFVIKVFCNGKPSSKIAKAVLGVNGYLFTSFFIFFRLFLHGTLCGILFWRNNDLGYVEEGIVFEACVVLSYALNLYWAHESISSSEKLGRKKAKSL